MHGAATLKTKTSMHAINAGDCTKAPNLLNRKQQKYMDPILLNLGIHWLPAVDAIFGQLAACRKNGITFCCLRNKKMATFGNKFAYPSGIPSLEKSADYRRLAMGLCLRDSKGPPAPSASRTPSTRPENSGS
jgi:hypothetical protein